MQKPQAVLSLIVVPFLVLIASLFFWSGLSAIGFFQLMKGMVAFVALPFCVYCAAIVVWILNPVRWDIVPEIVAGVTTISFLLGAALLTNFVGLGLNPSPVLDIFFTSKGLNQTLPYFLDRSDALNSNRTIFQFLISPAIASVAGLFLSSVIRWEKSGDRLIRLKQGGLRFAIGMGVFLGICSLGNR